MTKTKKIILGTIAAVLVLLTAFTTIAFALTGDGNANVSSSNAHGVSGGYSIPATDESALVGYRFSWLKYNGNGYLQNGSIDVFKNGYSPASSGYPNHIKATIGSSVYRNRSKYFYKSNFSTVTITEESYSSSTGYKYCTQSAISGLSLPSSVEDMPTWGKIDANINLILNKIESGANVKSLRGGDYVLIEPIFQAKINKIHYSITMTEVALLGCVQKGNTSDGDDGYYKGGGWGTICKYTNKFWPSYLYTSDYSSHPELKISNGSKLSSQISFYNIVTKGYGLMVVWNTQSYNIKYNLEGGSFASGLDSTTPVSGKTRQVNPTTTSYGGLTGYDSYFRVQTPTKTGYTFTGWTITGMDSATHYYYAGKTYSSTATSWASTSTAGKATDFYNLRSSSGTVIFTANWKSSKYTIKYYIDGEFYSSQTCTYGEEYELEDPYSSQYAYTGWWTNSSYTGTEYKEGSTQTCTGDKSYYAKTYIVLYFANTGGYGTLKSGYTQNSSYYIASSGSTIKKYLYKQNNTSVCLPKISTYMTRAGYTETGWSVSAGYSGEDTYEGGDTYNFDDLEYYAYNGTVHLWAQWRPNRYTVKYYLDGTEVEDLRQVCDYGESYTYSGLPTAISDNDAHKPLVKGWCSGNTVTSTGTQYTAGASFKNLSKTDGDVIERYAYSYVKVIYRPNGGTVGNTTYTDNGYGSIVYNTTAGGFVSQILYYGQQLGEYGLWDGASFGLTKTGYTFGGWLSELNDSTEFNESKRYTYDDFKNLVCDKYGLVYLKAKWVPARKDGKRAVELPRIAQFVK